MELTETGLYLFFTCIASALLLGAPGHSTIRYAATLPGIYGLGVAFIAEVANCLL